MKSQTMIRICKDKDNPYVMLNKQFLQDEKLSWKAKGILAYLLSLPDDWKIYETELKKHSADGLSSLKSGLKELMVNGYVSRIQNRNEKGQFISYEYQVYEVSTEMRKSDSGKSNNGKSHTTNNYITDNDLTNYKNDNGILSNDKNSTNPFLNPEIVSAMSKYMNDLYVEKTGKKHPHLKPEQYKRVYDTLDCFCDENAVDEDGLIAMMIAFLNSEIDSDWNINHFATEGILMNRFWEELY